MKKYSILHVVIFTSLIMCLTIGFSAYNLEMNIDDIVSYYKAPSNIRITGISIDNVNDSYSYSEDYGVDNVYVDVDLAYENSSITYLVEVTNLGGTYMVISELNSLHDNLTYEFVNYDLKHIICDDNEQCTLGITKQIQLKIMYKEGKYDSSNTFYNLNLGFKFEEFGYTIYYDSGYGLPDEYQEVDYIESTGSQRINTTYIPKTNTSFELDLSFSGSYGTTGGNGFLSSVEGDYTFSFNFGANATQNNTIFPWINKTYSSGATVKSFVITDAIRTKRNTLKYSNGTVTYGSVTKSTDKKSINHTTPIYLFGTKTANFSRYDMKVYRLKFYEGDILVADYVPCYRVSDGRTGLFDIVGRYFVDSLSDSEFNVGEEKVSPELDVHFDVPKQIIRYNESVKLRYNTFIKYDFMFVEWNTKLDGTGEVYNNRQNIYNLTDVSGTEIYLFAQWEPEGLLGNGSYDSPFLINNIEDLLRLSNIVNNGTNTFDGQYILMTRNLDFNLDDSYMNPYTTEFGDINGDGEVYGVKEELTTGLGFPPIGKSYSFNGIFNGGGYTLSNLYIYNSSTGKNGENLNGFVKSGYLSLFSVVKRGSISNLEVTGSIYTNISLSVAGIVGYMDTSVLNNLTNRVSVEINASSNTALGGLVGYSIGTSKILNSSNHATVMSSNTTSTNKNIIGGIIGNNRGQMLIKNSYNTGELRNAWRLGGISAGAITNESYLVIDRCYNTGNIISNPVAPSGENMHLGGLVGLVWVSSGDKSSVYIINSYNTGNVTTTPNKDAGGLVGAVTSEASAYIFNSYNSGKITGEQSGTYAAGILNYSGNSSNLFVAKNIFNYGKVSGKNASYSVGQLTNSISFLNVYYNNANTGSNKTGSITGMKASAFNTQSFVDTLNNNLSTIDLDNDSPIKLATDYEVSLCQWILGDKGYPELTC